MLRQRRLLMAKQKKILIKDLDEALKRDSRVNSISNVEWNGLTIQVKYTISLKDMMTLVDGVVRACFTDEGTYLPEVKNFALKCSIIDAYTNIALPSDIERQYAISEGSGLFEYILPYICHSQVEDITKSIDDKVSTKAQANIEMIKVQVEELYNKFDDMLNSMNEVMSQINPEDISKLSEAMSSGALSEEKIVEAFMKQSKPKTINKKTTAGQKVKKNAKPLDERLKDSNEGDVNE